MYKRQIISFFILLLSLNLAAQHKIAGRVTDKSTGQSVAFATLQVKNEKNSLTNENGEFEIAVNQLPVSITVSHLSYESLLFQLSKADEQLKFALSPKILTLKEVSVGNPAVLIMQEASDKALKNYEKTNYGKAFLRQIAYENDKPTYMNEIVMDAAWKPYGLMAWHPTEARHLKGINGISYTNTSFFSFILSGYLANSVHKKPLLRKVDSLYSFKLAGTYEQNGEEIAKIICTPKKILKGKRFEGIYYVNTVTNDIVKIEGTVVAMNFKASGPVSIKNIATTLIAQYKLNAAGDNVLDYSIFNSSNKLKLMGFGVQNTDIYTTLYMTDSDGINKDQLKDVSPDINDSDLVKAMNANPDFWKNNQGIKRTEKEQKAIEILEKIPQKK